MTDQLPQPPKSRTSFVGLIVDVSALGGAALITYGVSQVYIPAAFMVAGAFLLLGAWLLALRGV